MQHGAAAKYCKLRNFRSFPVLILQQPHEIYALKKRIRKGTPGRKYLSLRLPHPGMPAPGPCPDPERAKAAVQIQTGMSYSSADSKGH